MNHLQCSYTWGRRIYYFMTGLGIAVILSGMMVISQSQPLFAAVRTLPTQVYTTSEGEQIAIADPTQMTINTLPPFIEDGCIDDRCWSAGQSPADVFTPQELEGLDPQEIRLAEFPNDQGSLSSFEGILQRQTLSSVVTANPELGEKPISESPFLVDRLTPIHRVDLNQSLTQAFNEFPQLQDLDLVGPLDLNSYSLTDIDLANTKLGAFKDWQTTPLNTTSLGDLALSNFPNPFRMVSTLFGKADLFLSVAEGGNDGKVDFDGTKVLTGGQQSGFNAPCADLCSHIEIVHPGGSQVNSALNGKLLVGGDTQKVKGGHGVLGNVNDGWEPAGLHPFGPWVKFVVTNIDEKTDTARIEAFYRTCHHGIPDLGCTPYSIRGFVYNQQVKNGDLIFLGLLPTDQGTAPSTPTQAARTQWETYQNLTATPSSPNSHTKHYAESTSSQTQTSSSNSNASPSQSSLSQAQTSAPSKALSTDPPKAQLATLNKMASDRQQNQIGPRQGNTLGNCYIRVGNYGVPSNVKAFRDKASPELVSALDYLANLPSTCTMLPAEATETASSDRIVLQNNSVDDINLPEKFREEFPDGGKEIALEWLEEVSQSIDGNTDAIALTTENLTRAVFWGTHLPRELSDISFH